MKKTAVIALTAALALCLGGCGFGGNGRANVNSTAQNAPEGTKGVDVVLDNWRTFFDLVQEVEPVYENGEVTSLNIVWRLKVKDEYVILNDDGSNSNEIDIAGRSELITQTVEKAVWHEDTKTFEILDADPEYAAESDVSEPVDFTMTDVESEAIVEGSEGIFGEMSVDGDTYTANCDAYLYAEIIRINGTAILKAQQ